MLSEREREEAVRALADAEARVKPIAPVTETFPGLEVADAYAIQRLGIERRVADGEVVRGHKLGLTSSAMQEQLGVSEPDYGHLLSGMFVDEGMAIPVRELCSPRVEGEVAFVLSAPLSGPGVTVADVLAATAFLLPALEVIDSRIADWRITLPDTIADNASSGRVVLGSGAVRLGSVDPRLIGVVLRKNGNVVECGASGAVLGSPVTAVRWLANTLAEFDVALEPGAVILSGSCTRSVPVAPGDDVRADFDQLGHVSVRFT